MGADRLKPAQADEAPFGGRRNEKIRSFEGLRGLLSLSVCIYHFGLNTALERLHVRFDADLAVAMFFILSGFVLTLSYYENKGVDFYALATGRIARLYPLHFVTLLWALVLALKRDPAIDWFSFAQHLALIQNAGIPGAKEQFNPPAWSISVEMIVSLALFPLLRNRAKRVAMWAIVPMMILFAYSAAYPLKYDRGVPGHLNWGMELGLAGFFIGVTAYFAAIGLRESRWFFLARAVAGMTIFALFFIPLDFWLGLLFGGAALIYLVILAQDRNVGILGSRPLVYLGAISYSVYRLHIPIMFTAAQLFGDSIRGLGPKSVLVVFVLIASAICHKYFEVPAQNFFKRFFRRARAGKGVGISRMGSAPSGKS